MSWHNVKLIFMREVRDQLRDRRTLFMIAVLPMLLYPLLGMSMSQIAMFVRQQATRVLLIGNEQLPLDPPLLAGDHFVSKLAGDAERARLLKVTAEPTPAESTPEQLRARARQLVQAGTYEAVILFPADFADQLAEYREHLQKHRDAPGAPTATEPAIPSPEIHFNTANEKSQITNIRVAQVLEHWTDEFGRQNLAESNLPPSAIRPFVLDEQDVADKSHRDAAMWSKILPFLLLIWALTGAFYPAVDLCAGEKERGTLETLLISPAERSEIVWGKLFTVMLFSVATAVLNLASMGLSAAMILSNIPNLGPPPPLAPLWLLLALLPVAALFSALCLALAAFAKSSKEGQYYLMPVLLVSMPLMMLPMAPGVELSLGNSLIPITGVVLLLRAMLEGNYWQALPYVPVVVGVTMACCLFAVRWAIDQFNSESVLFRESERLDIGLWLRQVLRDREDTPSAAAAILCCMLILMVQYFLNFAIDRMQAGADPGEINLLRVVLVSQLVAILTPALLMTLFAARSARKTLLLRLPRLSSLPAMALLAVALFPSAMVLNTVIQRLYPISESVQQALQALQTVDYPWWVALGLFALTPAICEELAFRGFVLSGFRHLGHKWRAIALSAFFFGITHSILQQSISACVLGLVIGYIAVQTSSILPGMTFHFTHNALGTLGISWLIKAAQEHPQTFGWLLRGEALQESVAGSATPPEFIFTWPVVVASALVAILLLGWLHRLPYAKTAEEALQDARDHEMLPTVEYEV